MRGCVDAWMRRCVNAWMGGWVDLLEPRKGRHFLSVAALAPWPAVPTAPSEWGEWRVKGVNFAKVSKMR
jgi:hypothetical protein